MPLAWLGDDPVFDVPASVDEPSTQVEPELIQPNSPVLHPQSQRQQPPVKKTSTARATAPSSPGNVPRAGFPWWILVVVLIMADGKRKR